MIVTVMVYQSGSVLKVSTVEIPPLGLLNASVSQNMNSVQDKVFLNLLKYWRCLLLLHLYSQTEEEKTKKQKTIQLSMFSLKGKCLSNSVLIF